MWSFPLRERGLKPDQKQPEIVQRKVVPLAGTWIETVFLDQLPDLKYVVPLAGTWIETDRRLDDLCHYQKSFPLRERGLKPEGNR